MTRSSRGRVTAGLLLVAASGLVVSVAAPASAAECTVGTTQYIKQASQTLVGLGIPQSWRLATGQGVTVAVVDSGVNTGNAHLPAGTVVLPGTSFVPGDPTPDGRTDTFGHGTGVAGIIAARPIKGIDSGMIGAAPAAKILPVRVFSSDPPEPEPGDFPPTGARTAAGIRWAADHGADVINVSLSAPANNTALVEMKNAVEHAQKKGVVVVASSGDSRDGTSIESARYPASYPGVLGVSATNAEGVVDDYSVHGDQVDVSAPGSNVLLTFHGNGDCQTNATPQTSWAAPFVSALAAQLVELFPRESPEEIGYRITSTAQRPVAGARDADQGWGLIQPYEALTASPDQRRPGPTAPNQKDAGTQASAATPVRPMSASTDPLDPVREQALWWLIGAGGLAALALVARPLAIRSRRRR